jgi:superfamily II DNA or RNA helicase
MPPSTAPIADRDTVRRRLAGLRQVISPTLVEYVIFDGFDFAVKFRYFEGLAEVVKAHCRNKEKRWTTTYFGRKGERYFQYWKFPKAVIEEDAEGFFNHLREVSGKVTKDTFESFVQQFDTARSKIQPAAFTGTIKETIYPLKRGGVALIGSYHPGVVALAKNMGGNYLGAMRAWKLRNTSAIALKNNLMMELSLRDDQVEILDFEYDIVDDAMAQCANDKSFIQTTNNCQEERGGAQDAESEHEVYLAVTSPLKRVPFKQADIAAAVARYGFYDYQEAGFLHLVSQTSALLADDMGLGKSRQAVGAADFLRQGGKVLVACPASLIINWTREIQMILPDAKICTQAYDPNAEWVVTNYERLDELLAYADQFVVMITDEAHLLKEAVSKRTRLAFDIASKVPYRFILTGTPILNKESEIHTLLRLSGHPIGDIPLSRFEEEFAGNSGFRAELNKRIKEWMLRRKKSVVLKSLKGKRQQLVYVSPNQQLLSPYLEAANDSSLTTLAKIQKLRTTLEMIKLDAVMEMLTEIGSEDKALVFCEFKESVRELAARLGARGIKCVTLHGEHSTKRRQAAVDAFQDEADVQVFIGTTAAAGVGWNLTAANYVIMASLPWTPALKTQAEDRAYRNGQQRLVIVKIPLMEGTIDNDLWDMLRHKKGIANDILDPEEAANAAMEEFATEWKKAA